MCKNLALILMTVVACLSGCAKESEASLKFEEKVVKDTTCQKCNVKAGNGHVCGYTSLCDICNKDRGSGHVCTKTSYCTLCNREAGKDHDCGNTSICKFCGEKRGGVYEFSNKNHQCGFNIDAYCNKCKVDVGVGHNCIVRTWFCFECNKEVSDEHIHGRSFFCPKCNRERSIKDEDHKEQNGNCKKSRFVKSKGKEIQILDLK